MGLTQYLYSSQIDLSAIVIQYGHIAILMASVQYQYHQHLFMCDITAENLHALQFGITGLQAQSMLSFRLMGYGQGS